MRERNQLSFLGALAHPTSTKKKHEKKKLSKLKKTISEFRSVLEPVRVSNPTVTYLEAEVDEGGC